METAKFLVGARGFEPPTPCAQGRCATRLRYAPTDGLKSILADARRRHAASPVLGAGAVLMPGYPGILPTTLNEFWAMQTKYNIVEHLMKGIATRSGDYAW